MMLRMFERNNGVNLETPNNVAQKRIDILASGLIVAYGKFAALPRSVSDKALKKDDFPTLGRRCRS